MNLVILEKVRNRSTNLTVSWGFCLYLLFREGSTCKTSGKLYRSAVKYLNTRELCPPLGSCILLWAPSDTWTSAMQCPKSSTDGQEKGLSFWNPPDSRIATSALLKASSFLESQPGNFSLILLELLLQHQDIREFKEREREMLIYFCSHSKASVDMMADQKINYKRCYREVFSLSRQTDRQKEILSRKKTAKWRKKL